MTRLDAHRSLTTTAATLQTTTAPRRGLRQRLIAPALATLLALASAGPLPAAAQVGVLPQSWTLPAGSPGGSTAAPGMLFYPTAAAATVQRWGPFSVQATPGAAPTPGRHPLVLISHGTGGSELGHAWLAQALAAQGYLVAALRHPGDNHQDRSAVGQGAYFSQRPRQLSALLDALLADARWAPLIDTRRIAAIGHSAGGHSVLAMAGAPVDPSPLMAHCTTQGVGLQQDPVLCQLGGFSPAKPATLPVEMPRPLSVHDARLRAVVAAAPLGLGLATDGWPRPAVPALLLVPARDEVLVPRFHADRLCQAQPALRCVRDAQAGHFALFQAGTGPLGGPAGLEPSQDPAGFDRAAWQAQAWPLIRDFLAQAMPADPSSAAAQQP